MKNVMIRKILLLLIFSIKLSLGLYEQGENWAVLACGSNGYMNYRHQADVFHVYQSLLKRGFSKEHIILFAYDDIAYSPRNPFPGQVFNRPDGPDVYEGVSIDYSDYNVNPETYISVLKGDNKNGKLRKVLNSTENDNIFLYFVDHGIAGAIVFPDNKFLYADELEETFKFMKDKKMYKNIIFYLESCYSGSMFNNINPDLNVYSITAASPSEQSLATYCYPQDYVNGQEMHTCLSNEFTSNWIDDSDSRIFFEESQETKDSKCEYSSHDQFLYTKDKTKNSHVQEYGDLSVGDLPITYFQSSKDIAYYNNNHDGRIREDEKKKDKDEDKDDIDYEEIKRKIIEFDIGEEEIHFNSYENNENDFDEKEYDSIPIISSGKYNLSSEHYNVMNYIITKNKYMNRNKHYKNKNNKNDESLRGNSKKKKIIKDTKYNLLSTNVKLFYLELDISEKNDFKSYLDFRKEMEEMEKSKNLFELIRKKLDIPDKIEPDQKINYKCLRFSIKLFRDECGIDERDLEYISLFSIECAKKHFELNEIKDSIIELCKDKKEDKLLI